MNCNRLSQYLRSLCFGHCQREVKDFQELVHRAAITVLVYGLEQLLFRKSHNEHLQFAIDQEAS